MKRFLAFAILAASMSSFAGPAEDKAFCDKQDPAVDRDACMKEQRNARAEAKAGKLDTKESDLLTNRLARCAVHFERARLDCEKRVLIGTTTGSVSAGGTITEHRELVPAKK